MKPGRLPALSFRCPAYPAAASYFSLEDTPERALASALLEQRSAAATAGGLGSEGSCYLVMSCALQTGICVLNAAFLEQTLWHSFQSLLLGKNFRLTSISFIVSSKHQQNFRFSLFTHIIYKPKKRSSVSSMCETQGGGWERGKENNIRLYNSCILKDSLETWKPYVNFQLIK